MNRGEDGSGQHHIRLMREYMYPVNNVYRNPDAGASMDLNDIFYQRLTKLEEEVRAVRSALDRLEGERQERGRTWATLMVVGGLLGWFLAEIRAWLGWVWK